MAKTSFDVVKDNSAEMPLDVDVATRNPMGTTLYTNT